MGGGGHLSGSNVHCASPTHPNLCMSDVLSMTADRTNCLIHVKRKCLKFGFGAALIIPRKHVDAASIRLSRRQPGAPGTFCSFSPLNL